MRLYKPDNATVLKGALRNLLDGICSLLQLVWVVEQVLEQHLLLLALQKNKVS